MDKTKAKLILLRHGASLWNQKNIFTGWVDIPLSPKGIEESFQAGKKIATTPIDVIFTSSLIRAQMTAMLAMSVHRGIRSLASSTPMENSKNGQRFTVKRRKSRAFLCMSLGSSMNGCMESSKA